MGKQRIKHGDVFAVPLPDGTNLFGRVMLDVHSAKVRRLFPPETSFLGMGKALLVEMYDQPSASLKYEASSLLIPGAFIEANEVGSSWPVVSNVPVDPRTVQFPEAMIGEMHSTGEVAFVCGEIHVLLPITLRDLESMSIMTTRHSSFLWAYVCLHQLGRGDEVPEEYVLDRDIHDSDLRATEFRERVYAYLPYDANDTYFDQQEKMGLDLSRLYA